MTAIVMNRTSLPRQNLLKSNTDKSFRDILVKGKKVHISGWIELSKSSTWDEWWETIKTI